MHIFGPNKTTDLFYSFATGVSLSLRTLGQKTSKDRQNSEERGKHMFPTRRVTLRNFIPVRTGMESAVNK